MRKIRLHVNEKQKDYTIFIGTKLIKNINSLINCANYSNALIVADNNIPKSVLENIQNSLPIKNSTILLQGSDQQKNIESVQQIWKALLEFGADRKSLVINVGGGSIGDVGGFAASTFMRGVDFIQIPTTLLAQVDASVGGKVGINFAAIKNLIGAFQQPVAVIIDIDTLSSLSQRDFTSGFAEIIKHGAITDESYFKFVTSKKPQDFSADELVEIITKSCQIKTDIVSSDEKESGLRKLLNFGHTIGHALEVLSHTTDNPLLHGEAISIGMVLEGRISQELELLSQENCKILEGSLIKAGLPTKTPNIQVDELLEKIKTDKKREKGDINWTLLQGIGRAIIDQKVDESIIRKVI